MKISCENVRSLLASYLDGELSEEQAAPMRGHLLDCRACREAVQEGKVLKRWFAGAVDEAPVVPRGFASRVARRAFAGDPGLLVPEAPARELAPILPFVLKMTVVAAGLLFCFALFIQKSSLPAGNGIEAERRPFWEIESELGADVPAPPSSASSEARGADESPEDDDEGEVEKRRDER